MTALWKGLLTLAVITPVSGAASSCTSGEAASGQPPSGSTRPARSEKDGAAPFHAEERAPLSAELEQLKQAIRARDADKLWALLAPDGVECGDYLYGRAEYDALVRPPDGRLREWLFGTGAGGRRSVRTYLESGSPMISSQSATHRSAEFASSGGSLYIGFTLTNGRWLITEGLFCE
jgi:hypothetical protein